MRLDLPRADESRALSGCRNTTLRNVRIDWQQPYNSQATIVSATDTYLDMWRSTPGAIPTSWRATPWPSSANTACNGSVPEYTNLYDAATHELLYQTRDVPLGRDMFRARVTDLGNNRVRFHYRPAMKPAPGTVVVFFHGRYITNGIEIADCRQTRIEQVTIHHTLSCGVFGVRSHDVAMVGLDIVADERSGRVFQHHRRRHRTSSAARATSCSTAAR